MLNRIRDFWQAAFTTLKQVFVGFLAETDFTSFNQVFGTMPDL